MKHPLLITVLFIFSTVLCHAQWQNQLIPLDSPVYRQIEFLMLESGQPIPDTLKPWSRKEAGDMLNRIHAENLSAFSLELLQELSDLYPGERARPKELTVDWNIKLTPELHGAYVLQKEGETPDIYPWLYTVQDRPPWLEIPVHMSMTPWLYMEAWMNFEQEPRMDVIKPEAFYTIPTGPYDLNIQFPHRAYINMGAENFDVTLGRLSHNWGLGYDSNLLVSNNADWLEGLRLKLWYEHFSYTYFISSLEPRFPEGADNHREYDGSKYVMYHNFSFSPRRVKGLHFSLTEALILGGADFQIQLAHFNPMMFYHNWFPNTEGNSYHMIELDYSWRKMKVYAQMCLDQYQSAAEKDYFPDYAGEPNAFGYMLGTKRSDVIRNGFLLSGFEAVLTLPYLYTHEDHWTNAAVYQFYSSDKGYFIEYPLGYSQGPDVLSFTLYGEYSQPGSWELDFSQTWQIRGENRVGTPYPDNAEDNFPPTGKGENAFITRFKGYYWLNEHLKLGSTVVFSYRDNPAGHILDEHEGHYTGSMTTIEGGIHLCYQIK